MSMMLKKFLELSKVMSLKSLLLRNWRLNMMVMMAKLWMATISNVKAMQTRFERK